MKSLVRLAKQVCPRTCDIALYFIDPVTFTVQKNEIYRGWEKLKEAINDGGLCFIDAKYCGFYKIGEYVQLPALAALN